MDCCLLYVISLHIFYISHLGLFYTIRYQPDCAVLYLFIHTKTRASTQARIELKTIKYTLFTIYPITRTHLRINIETIRHVKSRVKENRDPASRYCRPGYQISVNMFVPGFPWGRAYSFTIFVCGNGLFLWYKYYSLKRTQLCSDTFQNLTWETVRLQGNQP